MSNNWEKTITINEKIAREVIEKQKLLSVKSIQPLDEGWDNLVFLVNGNLVFRFPRREWGVTCMEHEIALLPYLSQHVSFPIPKLNWIGKASDDYPYPFAGYEMLKGEALCEATGDLVTNIDFAETLGSWLRELHDLEVKKEHDGLIKGDQSWRLNITDRITICRDNIKKYETFFIEAGFHNKVLSETIEIISTFEFCSSKKAYLHGDLYCRHVLVNQKQLLPVGLIDWGDVHIGHPGIDLSIGMIFKKPALEKFISAYASMTEEDFQAMLFRSFCHSLRLLPYAFHKNDSALKHWAAMVLQRAIDEINHFTSHHLGA